MRKLDYRSESHFGAGFVHTLPYQGGNKVMFSPEPGSNAWWHMTLSPISHLLWKSGEKASVPRGPLSHSPPMDAGLNCSYAMKLHDDLFLHMNIFGPWWRYALSFLMLCKMINQLNITRCCLHVSLHPFWLTLYLHVRQNINWVIHLAFTGFEEHLIALSMR